MTLDNEESEKREFYCFFRNVVLLPGTLNREGIDDTAKGGLSQFQELFTVIPCAPKDFKR